MGVQHQPKESEGALFLVRDRYGDDCRGVALFCLSGPDEAVAAEVDRNAGSVAAQIGVRAYVGGVGFGVSGANGMKRDALVAMEGWGIRVGKSESMKV